MGKTIGNRLEKLEAQTGPSNIDEITFKVFLVKSKNDQIYRREYPDGKYVSIDPKSLGITPYKPTTHPPKVEEPSVNINVPKAEEYIPLQEDTGFDYADFERWWNSDGTREI